MGRFRSNFTSGVMLAVVSIITQLITVPVFLYKLGAELYGIWALLGIVMLVGRLGDLGLADSIIRHVALAYEHGTERYDFRSVTAYAVTGIWFALGSGLLAFAIIVTGTASVLSVLNIPDIYRPLAADLLPVIAFSLIIFLMSTVARAVLAGLQRLDIANYIGLIALSAQVILSVVMVLTGYGLWSLVAGVLAYHGISLAAFAFACWRYGRVRFWKVNRFNTKRLKQLVNMGYKLVLARLVSLGIEPLVAISISRFVGIEEVAFFEIARRAVVYLRQVIASGLNAVLPRVSHLDEVGVAGSLEVAQLNKRLTRGLLLFGLPSVVVLGVGAPWVFAIWLGDSYNQQISMIFQILLLPYFVNTLNISAYVTLIGWGYSGWVLSLTLIAALVLVFGLAVNMLNGFSLGINGIMAAYACSLIVGAVTGLLVYRSKLAARVTE